MSNFSIFTPVNSNWLAAPCPGPDYNQWIVREVAFANFILLPIGFLVNVLHFLVLLRHSSAKYLLAMCSCSLIYALSSWLPSLLYVLRPETEECFRTVPYSDIIVQLSGNFFRDTCVLCSSWIVIAVGVVSVIRSDSDSKIINWTIGFIVLIAAFWNLAVWMKHLIYTAIVDMTCELQFRFPRDRYMAGIPNDRLKTYQLIVLLNRYLKAVPVFIYPLLIISLIISVIRGKEERRSETLLIAMFSMLFLIFDTPHAILPFLDETGYGKTFSSPLITLTTYSTIGTAISQLLHAPLCFIVSSEYRRIVFCV